MKTRLKKINILIMAVLLFGIFCFPIFLTGCGSEIEKENLYEIYAVFNDETKTLACSQKVEYVNTSDNALNEICFFLYANSFREGQKVVSDAYFDRTYPSKQKSFGEIEIFSAKINDISADFEICEDGNILTVKLSKILYPNEKVEIYLEYNVKLANIRHRLGYGNNTINFGNFFPIICVYENGFVKNEFSMYGDPFYSEVSNFVVEINYPNKFLLASSGNILETKEDNENQERNISVCRAERVRDFCFVLSDRFEKRTEIVDDIEVNYYFYDDEFSNEHLKTAVKAVQTFGNLFGKYPYSQLSVVKADFCFGGMEYPNLVLIADDISKDDVDYVIAHEIAHQWWYGVVGNNQFENAWVDEGLTEFSTALFFENNAEYGIEYEKIMSGATENYKNFLRIYKEIYDDFDESIDRNINSFRTEPEYVNHTYTKGMLMFDSLRKMLGDRKFFKVLKEYYKDFSFENSSSEKLVQSFSEHSHINLEKFFEAWLKGKVVFG